MEKVTTIKINKETKQRLDKLKEHNRETYDQILRKILFILNISKKNPEKARKLMNKIDSSIKRRHSYTEVYGKDENK